MDSRLFKAAQLGDVASLLALLDEEPLILEKTAMAPIMENPLHVAALVGKSKFVHEVIVRKPSFAGELNQDGFTPLHIASAVGNIDVVEELLTLGPHLCLLKDKLGMIALHHAAMKGRVTVIEELFRCCPESLKERTTQGETALHLAVKSSQVEAFKTLAEKLDDRDIKNIVNSKDKGGNMILQMAVASKQLQVLEFLKGHTDVGVNSLEILSNDQLEGAANSMSQATQTQKGAAANGSVQSDQADQSSEIKVDSSIWSEVENMVLVVASLIATVTYEAGLSPPESIWKDDMQLGKRCTADKSFFSVKNFCPVASYYFFMSFNTSGFFSAIFLIFFFRKPTYVQVLLPVALISMMITYITLSISMSPNGLSLLIIYIITLSIFLYCILAVEVVRSVLSNTYKFAAGKVGDIKNGMMKMRKSSTTNDSTVEA